ncbi:MAG: hypothetical protein EBS05_02055 [Proteobacteria bacterium]|nr:hypothetical protein [Pseudomonadota bacterium]
MNTLGNFFQLRATGDSSGLVQGGDYVALIMVLLLLSILGIAALFVWLATRQARLRRREMRSGFESPPNWARSEQFRPEIFDSPCRWIAIRTTEPRAVQKALKLANATICTWAEGLAEARDRRIFITPPIGEWVLVVGPGLPDPGDDVDACFHLLTKLSRELGLVQFFCLNRALGHHAWARLDAGEVLRAYAWAGHVVWHQGSPSPAELGLDLRCFEYLETVEPAWGQTHDPILQNLDRLPMLAARWSVDPTSLDGRHFTTGRGIVGELNSRSVM